MSVIMPVIELIFLKGYSLIGVSHSLVQELGIYRYVDTYAYITYDGSR